MNRGYPERRWGIMALAVPIDFKPIGSEGAKWTFQRDGCYDGHGPDDAYGLIHKEPKLDAVAWAFQLMDVYRYCVYTLRMDFQWTYIYIHTQNKLLYDSNTIRMYFYL